MIPKLLPDGRLPPGEHHATLNEVLAAFPATTLERTELQHAIQDAYPAMQKLKSMAPDVIIYLDGSYVTSKPSPNDIDLLFLTNIMDEDQIIAFFQQECPIAATYLDIHADPIGLTHLVDLFTVTRTLQPKGIIVLDV